jgi:hypothetical protein
VKSDVLSKIDAILTAQSTDRVAIVEHCKALLAQVQDHPLSAAAVAAVIAEHVLRTEAAESAEPWLQRAKSLLPSDAPGAFPHIFFAPKPRSPWLLEGLSPPFKRLLQRADWRTTTATL